MDYAALLHEKGKIIEWLIDGAHMHGLPVHAASYLTKERICELYNVDISFFIR